MTDIASSSRLVLRYAPEAQFGVKPTTGNHKRIPLTGESLNYDISKTQSEEIVPDRGIADMIPTESSASGSVNIEMKASAYDDFIEAGLQGTWADLPTTNLDITVEADGVTLTATSGTFPTTLLSAGQFFALSITGNSPNKGKLFRISSAANSITTTVLKLNAATPATPETLTGVHLLGSRLRNGGTMRSFFLEKHFSDINTFRGYLGMNVAGFTVNASQGAITTGEIQFMGRSGTKPTNATQMPGTMQPLADTRPMTGMTGAVCGVWLEGAPLAGTYLSSLALTVDNGLRAQNAMCSADANGVAGAIGIGNGTFTAKANLEIYFTDEDTLYSEFVDNRNVELAWTAFDTEGYGYVFTLLRANITTHTVNGSGNNQDVMATIETNGLTFPSADAKLNGAVLVIDRIKL